MTRTKEQLEHLLSLRPSEGPRHPEQCLTLARAFLSLETLWLDALGMPEDLYPCADLAGALGQTCLPDDIELAFRESMFAESTAESRACRNYIRWCILKDSNPDRILQVGIDDPFVPMLKLFEEGGKFSIEGWMFDIQKCGGINVRALRERLRSRHLNGNDN